ncbi:MAG: hypothetical protein AMQ22_01163 [Candidatus Methanofastidiosum methylothiophilum]|uniref:Uncharacterized protein n=1 Tax=Candidatus Methanofastidiosum methylothiophilum TaxID=1705564 RepID=A0A150J3I3_9EURY|nr:MAG: hypothetical protein AMQ22_01163 [Candidatus Methanofastidiosum methylthiophilus]
MKKIFAIFIGLLFLVSTFALASAFSDNASYIYPNKTNYTIGEKVIVKSDSGYNALETPNGVLEYNSSSWDGPVLTMVWKAKNAGTVKFYSPKASVLIKVAMDKPTPMQQFMNILGFGKKD